MSLRVTEAMTARVKRLMRAVIDGEFRQNSYEPWEMKLLLDLRACQLPAGRRRSLLLRYQRAVIRRLESGNSEPLLLSEYLKGKLKE